MSKRSISIFFAVAFYLFAGVSFSLAQDEPKLTDEDKTKMVEEMFTSPYTEEMYYRTDELLLTATGSLLPVHKAPSVASIITSKDIEEIGATTLDEVLETVPGLHVVPSDTNRLDSIFSIRGIHTSINPQVLMLINGVPITQLYSGGRPFTFRMPVTFISRVEVIRGPGSAVHGADAFAGVINIITKDGFEIDGTRVGVRAGSFDSYDVWLQQGGSWAGWNTALSLEYITSNGDNDRVVDADLQTSLDSAIGTNASNAPTSLDTSYEIFDTHLHVAKKEWTFRFWSWVQNDAGMGTGVTNVLSDKNEQNNYQLQGDLSYEKDNLLKDLKANFRASYVYKKEDSFIQLFPEGAILPIGTDGNIDFSGGSPVVFTDGVLGNPILLEEQSAIDLTFFYSGLNRNNIRFGTGYKYLEEETEEYKNFGPGVIDGSTSPIDGTLTDVSDTPYIFMEDQIRRIFYVSLQDEWSFARKWELTAGVRYDDYSDFGGTTNPRLALVWETRYDLTSKLLYGRAFRPPSFLELYSKNNPASLGNKDLDPETIETLELAFDYQPTLRFRTLLNVFYYEVEDLIELVNISGIQTAQNAKDQNGYGFEIEAEWEITNDFTLKSNCAFQRSKDADTDEIVADAPELQFYVNAHWIFLPKWSFNAQVYWIGYRHRDSADTRTDINNYTLTNILFKRKNIFENWDVTFAAKNLFDENIREPSSPTIPNDIPMSGRSFYGEIRYHF